MPQFTLRVSFTYRADEDAEAGTQPVPRVGSETAGLKTFLFDTQIYLGRVEA